MKITLEHQGMKVFVENEDAVDITEAMDMFEELLVKGGFMVPRIEAGFIFKGHEVEKRREEGTAGSSI